MEKTKSILLSILPLLHNRATLQIEVVDVNDNPPYFLGGPFPLELIIPAGSPPGVLIRRLEIIDFDQGIGGISKFSLIPEDNKNNSLFSLNSPQCKWPKCSVELRLKESMFEGERASIKVLARDGAGITHKRSNTAEIKINVVAVADRANKINKNEGEEEEENKEEEEDDEFNEEKDEIFFNSNFRNNISFEQNIIIETTTKGFTGLFEK
uniref:Cadherin domain-containing protein n=1 Tax=Meloidogyne incognita TaxID=6306 RepID=A0A914NIM7_MELIC